VNERLTAMHYLSRKPAPPLDEYVEYLWLLNDAPAHARERIVPSGTFELVINLRNDEIRIHDALRPDRFSRHSGAVVSGTYGGFFVIDPRQHESMLGVHFRPGGAYPFLGVPAGDLADAHVDLQTLWGRSSRDLREQLCAASTPDEQLCVMERTLTSRLFRAKSSHPAVPHALRALARASLDVSVRDVAEEVGLSHRRFIEVFRAEVGLTPKLFCRVRRFQRVLTLAGQTAAPDWTRLALACGYCDQSHLINDFQAFSGLSPTGFVRHRNVQVKQNHVAVTAEGQIFPRRTPARRSSIG
jgi:AraC-like DNA-binding protein